MPGISSPKNHGASPKHPSTTSSGKPSMSTLKNATNSPSSKSSLPDSKSKSSSKDSRDKDKKLPGFNVNNKIKSTSVKLKPLELSTEITISTPEGLPSPSGTIDLSKCPNPNQVRNRKGSLSAIVDKLKSTAAHCDTPTDLSSKGTNRERVSNQSVSSKSEGMKGINKVPEMKNSEYMVKPSSDGIKITINKTRTKDGKTNFNKSSTSGTGSPKTHTGLKPGVTSGPASKKPQQVVAKNLTNSTFGGLKSTTSKPGNKCIMGKSVRMGSPKMTSNATDLSRKDRPKLNKEKSLFTSRDGRKMSPTQNTKEELDSERALKMALSSYSSPLIMDGLMKNFQVGIFHLFTALISNQSWANP